MIWWSSCFALWVCAGRADLVDCREWSARWQGGTFTWGSPAAQVMQWGWTWSPNASRTCWTTSRMTSLIWMSSAYQVCPISSYILLSLFICKIWVDELCCAIHFQVHTLGNVVHNINIGCMRIFNTYNWLLLVRLHMLIIISVWDKHFQIVEISLHLHSNFTIFF